jgi:hypothetical protein
LAGPAAAGDTGKIKGVIFVMRNTLILTALFFIAFSVAATPTRVTIRVLANDAKFVGTSMGGAKVVITDVETGAELASGLTRGGTGNTDLIMRKPRTRGDSLASEKSAAFSTSIDIDRPTRVRVDVSGPMAFPESIAEVSATYWLIPGRHVDDGNGWLLTLPGFVLELKDVPSAVKLGSDVRVIARLVMMCGCPTQPGGLWDSEQYELMGQLWSGKDIVAEGPLEYTGETSHFQSSLLASVEGEALLLVYALDSTTGNSAVIRRNIQVEK